jgi:hypothetical protein
VTDSAPMKVVKTLQLGPDTGWDPRLAQMRSEVAKALLRDAQSTIVQFSVTMIDPQGNETKWQYSRGSR